MFPSFKGPLQVGVMDIEVPASSKTLFMRIFYPCTPNESRPLSWASATECEGYGSIKKVPSFITRYLLAPILRRKIIPCFIGAPFLGTNRKAIVFSHGLCGCRSTYSYFCGDLASRGYVVFAIEHRDHSACLTYVNYNPIETDSLHSFASEKKDFDKSERIDYIFAPVSNLKPEDLPFRQKQLDIRLSEVLQAANFIKNTRNLDFLDKLDKDLIIAGHSFGGATVFHVLQQPDTPFSSGYAMDPWMFAVNEKKVYRNVTVCTAEHGQYVENITSLHNILSTAPGGITKNKHWTIMGAKHHSFSDIPMMFPFLQNLSIDPIDCLDLNSVIARNEQINSPDVVEGFPFFEKLYKVKF